LNFPPTPLFLLINDRFGSGYGPLGKGPSDHGLNRFCFSLLCLFFRKGISLCPSSFTRRGPQSWGFVLFFALLSTAPSFPREDDPLSPCDRIGFLSNLQEGKLSPFQLRSLFLVNVREPPFYGPSTPSEVTLFYNLFLPPFL